MYLFYVVTRKFYITYVAHIIFLLDSIDLDIKNYLKARGFTL